MGCQNGCLQIRVKGCENPIINIGLSPEVNYQCEFWKPGSKRGYIAIVTTDENGAFTLDKKKFPKGFFSAGVIMKGRLLDADYEVKTFTVNSIEYNCFLLEFTDIIEL